MNTIKLPDGYDGSFVECECEPIEKDGNIYKIRVKSSHLIRWCTRQQWENAMWEAYTEEAYASLESEYQSSMIASIKADERREELRRDAFRE